MQIEDEDLEEYFRKKSWPTKVHTTVARIATPIGDWMHRHRIHTHIGPKAILVGFALMIVYALLFASPPHFPEGSLVKVKKGSSISEVATQLDQKGLVHSATLFKVFSQYYGGVIAGEYAFTERQSVIKIAARMAAGDYELKPVRITVWDGATVAEITSLLHRSLPDFESEAFYEMAIEHEGKLSPDTYFFYPGDEPDIVLKAMLDVFAEKMRSVNVSLAVAQFGKPLDEIITMASLLEREAADMHNRRIIAGLLWDRIEAGMALQVDAAFLYINGKNTFELTKTDLTTNSPYNTYTNKGLPPGPIGNPSVDAIIAAATPIKTDYVYYLSDITGLLHYSKTYDEHLRLKARYID